MNDKPPTSAVDLLALEMARVDGEPAAWRWFIPDARAVLADVDPIQAN